MILGKKIGYIKTESFWELLQAFGLELSVKTGGYLRNDHDQYALCSTATAHREEFPVVFLSPELYCETVRRVEEKLKYRLFGQ